LNDAIEISKGKYIARMDVDDISHPERLERQVSLMEKENIDICGCHYLTINEDGKFLDIVLTPLKENNLFLYLLNGVPFAHGSVMLRKDFLSNKNLKYGSGFKFAEDKDLWVSMLENSARFSNVNEILFKYREYSQSLSKQRLNEVRHDDKKLKDKVFKLYQEKIYNILQSLTSDIHKLNHREIEYLADTILYATFDKFKMSYLKFFRKIPSRYKVIAFFKYISRIF